MNVIESGVVFVVSSAEFIAIDLVGIVTFSGVGMAVVIVVIVIEVVTAFVVVVVVEF